MCVISTILIFIDLNFHRKLAKDEAKITELENLVTNLSRESQDKRELLDSIQSDKETISKWVDDLKQN